MKTFWAKIVWALMRLLGKRSLKRHYKATSFVRRILEKSHYREYVAYTNLARSFPELKADELRKIVRDSYQHMAEIVVEAIFFGASDLDRLRKSGIAHLSNPEVLKEAFESSPSVTLLLSHAGNWEILSGFQAYVDDPESFGITPEMMKITYLKLHNEVWNEVFKWNRLAPVHGADCLLESREVIRYELAHKDEKKIYCHIADQYPYVKGVDIGLFMNQPTLAMMAGINLACKLHHSVLYLSMDRTEQGHYELRLEEICRDAAEMAPVAIARVYYDLLEKDLRANPMNYIWTHKRWK